MLANNINDHLEPIKFRRTFKEYLTMKEVQMLKYTPKGMKIAENINLRNRIKLRI